MLFENEVVFIFFSEMGRSERTRFSTTMNRQACNIGDRIDELAPAVALRLYLYVLPNHSEALIY